MTDASSELATIYDYWPEHFSQAIDLGLSINNQRGNHKSIVLCGMGGSGTSCDILHDLLNSYSKIPSMVVKGGRVPSSTDKNTLAIVFSASGNTQETILMTKQAYNMGAKVVCISAGGKMKELTGMPRLIHIDIPKLLVPRAALPYMLIPGLYILKDLMDPTIPRKISEVCTVLSEIRDKISTSVPYQDNSAKNMASFLNDGFVFCFTSPSLRSVGTRFKNSLNENAKLHCSVESVLEASHNEIVPFTYLGKLDPKKVLLVHWIKDSEISRIRFDKLCYFFSEIGQPFKKFEIESESLLNALVYGTYFFDFVSIYLAGIRKINPSPTPAIDILKRLDTKMT
jgi:glucose/mannose-6-phosphate isomerase